MAEPSLELLQAMVQRALHKLTEHDGEFRQIGQRLTAIERHLAGVRRDRAAKRTDVPSGVCRTAVLDAETTVNVQAQVDRLGVRSHFSRNNSCKCPHSAA
jgi:hypothetical protein